MNVAYFAARLYCNGHVAADYRAGGQLKPGLVIVSPLRPPAVSVGGMHIPESLHHIDGQFALAHVVEAIGPEPVDTTDLIALRVGDVVKCREAHLDPLDPKGRLLSVRHQHVLRVFGNINDGDADADADADAVKTKLTVTGCEKVVRPGFPFDSSAPPEATRFVALPKASPAVKT